MNFDLTDEQRMLDDAFARLLADKCDFETRQKFTRAAPGFDPALWEAMAEMGLFALPFSEEAGGLGGTAADTMLVMERAGRALLTGPVLDTFVAAPALLSQDGSDAVLSLIEEIIGGAVTVAYAAKDATGQKVTAEAAGEGFVLSGKKSLVRYGAEADLLIVSAELNGAPALFLVKSDAAGLTRTGYPTQDGQRGAEVLFAATPAVQIAGDAAALIAEAEARLLAAACAEAVGAMQALLDQTVDYLKTRVQFNVTLGSFQAVQHQAAEMMIATELARSMSYFASMSVSEADAEARARRLSAAKVQINRSAREVGQKAVQLHGGIAMTMELAAGHYFKRLTMIEMLFGDFDFHMDRLSALGGLGE